MAMKSFGLLFLCFVMLCVSVSGQNPSSRGRRVKCSLKEFPRCHLQWKACPLLCPSSCVMDCTTCKPVCSCDRPGAVCQDPRFIGGDGITFYFHGKKDRNFCLVSDQDLHINAHFIGKRNRGMTRDFTWVQSIAILFDQHQMFIGAQKTSTWDDSVDRLAISFNGQPISLAPSEGTKWQPEIAPHVSITRADDTNQVIVEVKGKFMITAAVVPITNKESRIHDYNISNDDCFAHLELGFKFFSLSEDVHGVLGQTYRANYTSRLKLGVPNPVMGGDQEFSTSNLFAADCAASRWNGNRASDGIEMSNGGEEYTSLQCSSGTTGLGVVCKR